MKNLKLILIALSIFVAPIAVQAQQGTTIIRDSATNTQASVKAAGTITPNVIGVQGNASGVPIPISSSAASGLTVNIISGSSATIYASDVAGSAVSVSTTTVAPFGTTTTLVQSLRCNNQNTSAVNFTVTDGNNVYFIGPNYSFPASSNAEFAPSPHGSIMTSGIAMSAGTAASIRCWLIGKQ